MGQAYVDPLGLSGGTARLAIVILNDGIRPIEESNFMNGAWGWVSKGEIGGYIVVIRVDSKGVPKFEEPKDEGDGKESKKKGPGPAWLRKVEPRKKPVPDGGEKENERGKKRKRKSQKRRGLKKLEVRGMGHGLPPGDPASGGGSVDGGKGTVDLFGEAVKTGLRAHCGVGFMSKKPSRLVITNCYNGHPGWLVKGMRDKGLAPAMADLFRIEVEAFTGQSTGHEDPVNPKPGPDEELDGAASEKTIVKPVVKGAK
jgi:hypothetical protein